MPELAECPKCGREVVIGEYCICVTASIDISFSVEWLEKALETKRAGGKARATVVVFGVNSDTRLSASVIIGGDGGECLVATMPGDFRKDSAWSG